jgi:hypothetical protein
VPKLPNEGVAFVSEASNLVPGGTNGLKHVFVRALS